MSVAGLSRQKHGFDPRPVHEGFTVNKLELEVVLLQILRFSPVTTIPLILRSH
jgi:hypothetical protein